MVVMVAHNLYKSIDLDYVEELMEGNYIIDARNGLESIQVGWGRKGFPPMVSNY